MTEPKTRRNNLSRAIKRLGLTQQQFAERLGITQGSVSRYCRGERVPSLRTAVAIANLAGIPVRSLIESHGEGARGRAASGTSERTESAVEVAR